MAVTQAQENLDAIFAALASKHRRAVIYALGLQPHSISQLAKIVSLSLPAIHKHIKVLEEADLIIGKKIGRVHFLSLKRKSLLTLQKWVLEYHPYWGSDKDTLENYLMYLQVKKGGRRSPKATGDLRTK